MNEGNLIPFQKGQSGNPNGRPKGRASFETTLDRWLTQDHGDLVLPSGEKVRITNLDEAVRQQIKKAREGDTQAFKAVMEFAFGKPLQRNETELTGGANPVKIIAVEGFTGFKAPEIADQG